MAKMFWNVFESFTNDERRLLLLFTWGQAVTFESQLYTHFYTVHLFNMPAH